MGHYSERVRREALRGLQDLLTHNPGELRKQVGWLQDRVLQLWVRSRQAAESADHSRGLAKQEGWLHKGGSGRDCCSGLGAGQATHRLQPLPSHNQGDVLQWMG